MSELVTLPYVEKPRFKSPHLGAVLTIPKSEKPFVVIDNVVYINAKLIKENTL